MLCGDTAIALLAFYITYLNAGLFFYVVFFQNVTTQQMIFSAVFLSITLIIIAKIARILFTVPIMLFVDAPILRFSMKANLIQILFFGFLLATFTVVEPQLTATAHK